MTTSYDFGTILFEKDWKGEEGRFSVFIDENFYAVARFFGKGSMAGARAFTAILDEGYQRVNNACHVRAIMDLRQLRGVPLRAQFVLGKWLLTNKHRFHRISVFGGNVWEMKFAAAVAKIARFETIGFFDDEESSIEYIHDADAAG